MSAVRQQNAPARSSRPASRLPGVPASPAEGDDARTEGQRLLRALPHSGVEVAEAVGASKQAVSAWRAGTKTPSPALRTRIERALGIPAAAWERTSLGRAPAAAPSVTRPVRRSGMTTIEDVTQLLEDLAHDAATDGLLLSDLVRIRGERVKALALKARIEAANALFEAEAVQRHPAWRRTLAILVEELRPHPDLARRIAERLQEVGTA